MSHQTEELLGEHEHDWVRNQFLTTRDAHTANFFTEWLWGGMQYQLLHHLFPDMPRYYYPALRPKVEVRVLTCSISQAQTVFLVVAFSPTLVLLACALLLPSSCLSVLRISNNLFTAMEFCCMQTSPLLMVHAFQALAAEHNIEYRQMDEWPLLLRNLKQYRDVALAPPDLKARLSAGGVSV